MNNEHDLNVPLYLRQSIPFCGFLSNEKFLKEYYFNLRKYLQETPHTFKRLDCLPG